MATPDMLMSPSPSNNNEISNMLQLRNVVKKNRQRDYQGTPCQDCSSSSGQCSKFIDDDISGAAGPPVEIEFNVHSNDRASTDREKNETRHRSLRKGWSVPCRWPRMRLGMQRRKVLCSVDRKLTEGSNQKIVLKANSLQNRVLSFRNNSSSDVHNIRHDNMSESRSNSAYLRRHGSKHETEHRCTNIGHKYQPKLFEDIAGHEITIKAISNAVQKNKVAHLYLFHGPSGTGKTSAAKVFAMALNCKSPSHKPCWSCIGCCRSLYVMELCSGSRITGFQRISTLLQSTSFTQTIPGYKVFIIEECHLLNAEAWDELLSTVEGIYDPTLVFVLITVDVNMVPKIISSRCQKFCFPKLKEMDIKWKLARIAAKEEIWIEREALKLITAKAEGSLREAENILEQLTLLGPKITISMVHQIVGLVPRSKLIDLLTAALSGDAKKTFRLTQENIAMGIEPRALVSQLASLITIMLSRAATALPDSSLFAGLQLGETQYDRLCHALKVLVEMEKQPRSLLEDSRFIFSTLMHIASQECFDRVSQEIVLPRGIISRSGTLPSANIRIEGTNRYLGDMDEIWQNMLKRIENTFIKEFLTCQVKLASLTLSSANAIIHLMFKRPEDKLAAQMSEENISKALKNAIGCPVTVNMSLEPVDLGIMEENIDSSNKDQLAECSTSREQQRVLFLPESVYRNHTSPGATMQSSTLHADTKLKNNMPIPQGQEKCLKEDNEAISALPQQLLDSASDTRTIPSVIDGGGSKMKTKKLKHRWLSLSSITQSDASVEPYSRDILFENANHENESRTRKNSILQKGFPKADKGQHLSRRLYRSWSCKDILSQTKTTIRKLQRDS